MATQTVSSTNYSASLSQGYAEMCFYTARSLSRPLWWTSKHLIEVAMPISNQERKCEEVFNKLYQAAFAAPFAPITFTLGGMACIPRLVGTYLQSHPFTHVEGNATEKWYGQRSKSFTILNLNICCMPGGLPYLFGGMAPACDRIDRIAQKIMEINPDVVCLEEVHDEDIAIKLYEKFKNTYCDFYWGAGRQTAGLDSGLFEMSKYKIENPEFTSYKYIDNASQNVNKGLFTFTISSNEGKIAHIFHTHLQPSVDDDHPLERDMNTRAIELELILKKMHNIVTTTSPSKPILLVGDLNIVYNSEEYNSSIFKECFQWNCHENPYHFSGTCSPYFTAHRWSNDADRVGLKKDTAVILDYAAILKKLPNPYESDNFEAITEMSSYTSESSVVRTWDEEQPLNAISDHHGIYTTVKFKNS